MKPTGLLMIVIGVFIVGRTLFKDSSGETLAGRLAGGQPKPASGGSSSSATATTASAGGGSTATTVVGKTGQGETAFAQSFLTAIKAPVNKTNVAALEDWWSEEEGSNVLVPGHGGTNNPFEVTTSGNANVPTLGSVNSAGVKSYATPAQGVQAAIGYFQRYGPGVLQAFQAGDSVSRIEGAVRALGSNAFGSDTDSAWGG